MIVSMRRVVLLAVLSALAFPAHAQPALKGWSGPKPKTPCRCRHAGGKALLGEKICQRRGGRMVTLRCDLVLNNTNWTIVGEGCDVAMQSTAPVPKAL